MTIIQLVPPIPMSTPKGSGLAWLVIDYGCEHNLMWTVAINETGEIWTFPNPEVRAEKNITMGRMVSIKSEEDKFDVIFDRMEAFENTLEASNRFNDNNHSLIQHAQEGIEKLFERIEKLDKYVAGLNEDMAVVEAKMKELENKKGE